MSFLTEYFDEFRQHPIRKTKMCRPENRWAKLEGKWLNPKTGTEDKAWTDDEIENFIKVTMRRLRGQSTYYNDYCSYLSPEFKTRPFVPRVKKLRPCIEEEGAKKVEEVVVKPQGLKLAMKDTELMKVAHDMYDKEGPLTLKPLPTHLRILGYVRPCLYNTGRSEYQESTARLAYELVRDDRIPPFHAHNGCRARWGLPPEGTRQPELDIVPFEDERLY